MSRRWPNLPKGCSRRPTPGKPESEWPIRYRYRSKSGQVVQETFKSGLVKDAERLVREIQNQKDLGVHVPRSETRTVGLALKLWLKHYLGLVDRAAIDGTGKPRMSTYDNYERDVRLHLMKKFGGTLLTDLNQAQMQRWADEMLVAEPFARRGGKRVPGKRYSINRIQCILIPLKLAVAYAATRGLGGHNTRGLVGHNIFNGWSPKLPEPPENLREFPDMPEARKIVEALDTRRPDDTGLSFRMQRPLFYLSMFAGLRESEACGLYWEHVDLEAGTIKVRRTMDRKGIIKPWVKSKHSRREVRMNLMLRLALEELARHTTDFSGPVIRNADGKPMRTSSVVQHYVPKIMIRAGLTKPDGTHKYTFHQLRHFAGSLWLTEDMPIDEVSRKLGHAKIEFTRKIYIHQLKHDTRAKVALDRIDALFGVSPDALPPPPPALTIEHVPALVQKANGSSLPAVVEPVRPPRTAREFRAQQKQRVVAMWQEGKSYQEIIAAEAGGVSGPTISEWVQEANGNIRRAVVRKRRYEQLTPEEHEARRQRNRAYYRDLPLKQRQEIIARNVERQRERKRTITPEQRAAVNARQRDWYARRKAAAENKGDKNVTCSG